MKVLIIEDEQSLLKILEYQLKRNGWTVLTASDGKEGLKKIGNDIDVILLDILLPGQDGLEVLAKIRKKYDNNVLPVVIVSSFSDISHIEKAKSLGVFSYLVKGTTGMEAIINEAKKAAESKQKFKK